MFSFGDHGLVCKTSGGWSLHRADGTLEAWFSTEGIPRSMVEAPVFSQGPLSAVGAFFVKARTGPSGAVYRLDVEEKRLVPAQEGKMESPP